MENTILLLVNPIRLSLVGTSTLLLVGFLLIQYYKDRFLPASRLRLAVVSPEQRRMVRLENHSILELGSHVARLVNISLGGVCFSSARTLRLGDRVQAKLHASKDWFLHLSGRVVWAKSESDSRQTLYGLEIEKAAESRS